MQVEVYSKQGTRDNAIESGLVAIVQMERGKALHGQSQLTCLSYMMN